jgi:hypothetical protein
MVECDHAEPAGEIASGKIAPSESLPDPEPDAA